MKDITERYPKNHTIIELINGREYLVKNSDYTQDVTFNSYYLLHKYYNTGGERVEWRHQKGSISINDKHILTIRQF